MSSKGRTPPLCANLIGLARVPNTYRACLSWVVRLHTDTDGMYWGREEDYLQSFMDFSQAFSALKSGSKIKRPSWAGYLILQVPDEHSKMNRPYIYAVCKDGEVVPAVLNNLDLMAEDWELAA